MFEQLILQLNLDKISYRVTRHTIAVLLARRNNPETSGTYSDTVECTWETQASALIKEVLETSFRQFQFTTDNLPKFAGVGDIGNATDLVSYVSAMAKVRIHPTNLIPAAWISESVYETIKTCGPSEDQVAVKQEMLSALSVFLLGYEAILLREP